MIRRISGKVADLGLNYVVVDVSGVGYIIYTNTSTNKLLVDSPITFFTHLAVRENALDLYGFISRDELEMFELLIDLPKIGPKSALSILTQADIQLIKESVSKNDPGYLSKMSGVGKKSAEKIVDGLKDKFDLMDQNNFDNLTGRNDGQHTTDTIDALITLGYSQNEARSAVQRTLDENPELKKSNELLRVSLKLLSK